MNILLKSKQLEEIIIILYGNNKTIFTKANKQILHERLAYFKNTSLFKENILQSIEIKIPDACNLFIIHDIILSCINPKWNPKNLPEYNIGDIPKCRYTLKYWKCCDFLCLPFNNQLLFDLGRFSTEDYDLLVDTMELLGYDKYKIWLMNEFLFFANSV